MTAPAPEPLVVRVGDVVAAKYRIDRILGVGGMGMVAAATHLELGQQVALKFMLPGGKSVAPTERFLREARAAVRLRGEHVCRVLDVGRHEMGAPYIVMEYMAGQDFAELLQKHGTLAIPEAVDHLLQVLEGIAEAHVAGIVHRDLKPSNIFVATDTDGSPLLKVLDFGISKLSFSDAATKTGDMMGTPMYMSPEQMTSAKHVDARADIWSLGCILYEALSGELPFSGESLPQLLMSVMNNPPVPITAVRPDVPAALAATIMRCLEKSPEARFDDVGRLAVALAPFGSASANASAVRITKVLGRILQPSPSNDAVAPTLAAGTGPEAKPAAPAVNVASRTRTEDPPEVASAPVELAEIVAPRRRTGLITALAIAAGSTVAIVSIVMKSSKSGVVSARVEPTPAPAVGPPAPIAKDVEVAPPAAVDPKIVAARAQLVSVIAGFVRWSSTHPHATCPAAHDLASAVTGGIVDPWGHPLSITCTEQPEDQMIGAISLGPDGVRSVDDLASWTLPADVTGLIRGPHWVATSAPATTSRPPRSRPPVATTSPVVTAPAPTPEPPKPEPPKPEPPTPAPHPSALGSNGLPIGRTSK